jgi:hypothetical protein
MSALEGLDDFRLWHKADLAQCPSESRYPELNGSDADIGFRPLGVGHEHHLDQQSDQSSQ